MITSHLYLPFPKAWTQHCCDYPLALPLRDISVSVFHGPFAGVQVVMPALHRTCTRTPLVATCGYIRHTSNATNYYTNHYFHVSLCPQGNHLGTKCRHSRPLLALKCNTLYGCVIKRHTIEPSECPRHHQSPHTHTASHLPGYLGLPPPSCGVSLVLLLSIPSQPSRHASHLVGHVDNSHHRRRSSAN